MPSLPLNLILKHRTALMGLAILWVMLFHAEFKVNNPVVCSVFDIGYGGVDVFLFLSGLGLYYSCLKKKEGFKKFYFNRLLRIFPTFWIALLIMFVIQGPYSLKGILVLVAKCTTLGLWFPFIPMYLWYVSLICLLYVIYPLFYRAYSTKPKITCIGVLTLSFIFILIYAISNINSPQHSLQILAVSRFPIFFIGTFFGRYIESGGGNGKERRVEVFLIIFMIIGFVILCLFRNYFRPYLWNCALSFLPFIMITPGICYVASILFDSFSSIAKLLTFLGSYTFEIYVLNEFLLAYCYPLLISNIHSENICKTTILILNVVLAIVLSKLTKPISLLLKQVYESRA